MRISDWSSDVCSSDLHTGSQRIEDRGEPQAHRAGTDVGAERTERDRAPDAQATAPHVQRGDRVLPLTEVEVVVRDHVIEPGTDQAEGDRPDGDVLDLPRLAATCDPALLAHPEDRQ